MTDKELLELAAKAAGRTNWQSKTRYVGARCDSEGVPYWNPLTDDGDALRLAVKLGMKLNLPEVTSVYASAQIGKTENLERVNGDAYAAIRQAIVRAAAEIGKGVK